MDERHWTERYHDGERLYMPGTDFHGPGSYAAIITAEEGPVIYSECCSGTMSLETAKTFHEALGRWITDADDPAWPHWTGNEKEETK